MRAVEGCVGGGLVVGGCVVGGFVVGGRVVGGLVVERCVVGSIVVGGRVVGGFVEDCCVETLVEGVIVEGVGLEISHGSDGISQLNPPGILRGVGMSEGPLGEAGPLWPSSDEVVKPASLCQAKEVVGL